MTTTPTPCQCNSVLAYTLGPDDTPEAGPGEGWPEGTPVYGPCGASTSATFAPGHDAKLKGLLIRLYKEGGEYHWIDGGLLISSDPMNEAAKRGWGHFLKAALDAANRPKRTTPKATKNKPVNKVPLARKVPREPLVPVPPKGVVRIGRRRFNCEVDVDHSDIEVLTVIYIDPKDKAAGQIRTEVPHKAFTPA